MADDLAHGSKRKHDDPSPAPPHRRTSGFSALMEPSPADGLELAKQRVQEIARQLNDASKRPRVENGGSAESAAADISCKPSVPSLPTVTQSSLASYGYGSSKKIDIPNARVGVIIGKSGETIKYLQNQSGAKIQVTKDFDADPNSLTRSVELMGNPEQISKAEQLIKDVLAEAEVGVSATSARKSNVPQVAPGAEQFRMMVPNNRVGLVIGKGGETIKSMQAKSGARIQVVPLFLPPGDTSTERAVYIEGSQEQIEAAKQLVNEVITGSRARNPSSGGYSQQGYHQSQPTTGWAPQNTQSAQQQSDYGYNQQSPYPAQAPNYTSQTSYRSYPAPASGGYHAGWDSSTVPSQQSLSGPGYNYYNQPPQPAGGATTGSNTANYNYSQPAQPTYNSQAFGDSGYSQPYGSQDGYAYSGGYAAPSTQQSYSQPSYSNQQVLNSTQGYVSNPSQDGAQSSYGSQGAPQAPAQQTQPPASQYPTQGTPSAGYGPPQYSQPVYGSQPPLQTGYTQPAPAIHPGYAQPHPGQKPPPAYPPSGMVQAGYPQDTNPPSHFGYGQDSTQAAAPLYGSGVPQVGYGQQLSGAPPSSLQAYNQQQQAYGGGNYAQPPAYPSNNAQPPVPSAGTKTSPS